MTEYSESRYVLEEGILHVPFSLQGSEPATRRASDSRPSVPSQPGRPQRAFRRPPSAPTRPSLAPPARLPVSRLRDSSAPRRPRSGRPLSRRPPSVLPPAPRASEVIFLSLFRFIEILITVVPLVELLEKWLLLLFSWETYSSLTLESPYCQVYF